MTDTATLQNIEISSRITLYKHINVMYVVTVVWLLCFQTSGRM